MSNIFQPYTRNSKGVLPLNIGVGELVNPVKSQGLNLDATGSIYAVTNGEINHYANALPFNLHGRLVVSGSIPAYFEQGIPFSSTGAVAFGGAIDHYDQSLAYDVESRLSTSTIFTGAFSSAFSFAFDRVT